MFISCWKPIPKKFLFLNHVAVTFYIAANRATEHRVRILLLKDLFFKVMYLLKSTIHFSFYTASNRLLIIALSKLLLIRSQKEYLGSSTRCSAKWNNWWYVTYHSFFLRNSSLDKPFTFGEIKVGLCCVSQWLLVLDSYDISSIYLIK